MSEELTEDQKIEISKRFKEIQERETVNSIANDMGISPTTVNKYKNYKPVMQKEGENETEKNNETEPKNFNDSVIPDNEGSNDGNANNDNKSKTENTKEDEEIEYTIDII